VKQTFEIPKGCSKVTVERIGNTIITSFEEEKVKFKKGDILFWEAKDKAVSGIIIYLEEDDFHINYAAHLSKAGNLYLNSCIGGIKAVSKRFANHSETKQIFDALAKKGKQWNAEKLFIEDLKAEPKVGDCLRARCFMFVFKGFDKNGNFLASNSYIDTDGGGRVVDNDIKTNGINPYGKWDQITKEELQSKYNSLGFEYDFENDSYSGLKWKPKFREAYFAICGLDEKIDCVWTNHTVDECRFKLGNCFKTESECQSKIDQIKAILK